MREAARIFKRPNSSALWIAYCHHGKEVRESAAEAIKEAAAKKHGRFTEEDAQRAAEKLLKLRLEQIVTEKHAAKPFVGPQQDRILVSELLEALETDLTLRQARSIKGIRSHLKQLRAGLGDRRAVDITTEAADRYIETRLSEEEPPAHATVNRETGLLAQAFKLGIERQRISGAPRIRKLSEKGNARQGFFEKSQYQEMLKHLPKELKGFVQFGYYSGWRKGEIGSLEWGNVDINAKVIRLRPENSKTKEGRVLALDGELWDVIARQWSDRGIKAGTRRLVSHGSSFIAMVSQSTNFGKPGVLPALPRG